MFSSEFFVKLVNKVLHEQCKSFPVKISKRHCNCESFTPQTFYISYMALVIILSDLLMYVDGRFSQIIRSYMANMQADIGKGTYKYS